MASPLDSLTAAKFRTRVYLRAEIVEEAIAPVRRLREIRNAVGETRGIWELADRYGDEFAKDAIKIAGVPKEEALSLLRESSEPRPKGLKTVFDFDGTLEELEAHNRAIKQRATFDRKPAPVQIPAITVTPASRPRERGPACSTRVRGSRRGAPSGRCRAGPSSDDDPPGDEPEPPSAGGRLTTLPDFHRLTPGLSGSERLALFEVLPTSLQGMLWTNLRLALIGAQS